MDNESPLLVYLEAQNNRVISRIKAWSIDSDYLVSTDGFEFTAVDQDPEALRQLEGEPVILTVGGAIQLVGRIDQSSRGEDGLAVTYSGRDYIADLVECNIDPTFVIKEKMTLGDAIKLGCSPIGIDAIADDSDVEAMIDIRQGIPGKTKRRRGKGGKGGNRSKAFKDASLDDLKPDIGQGMYEFFSPICARHGCTIQPTHQRNVLYIGGPFYEQDSQFTIIRQRNDYLNTNNVITATAHRDYSSMPSMIITQGQGAPRSGEKISKANLILDTWAEANAFGGELHEILNRLPFSGRRLPGTTEALPLDNFYRLNVFRDDKAKNEEQVANAQRRLFADHLKKSLTYQVRLKGHIDPVTGAIWTVDTIVHVYDEVCDILGEELWVQARKLTYGPQGAFTDLTCVRPGSFEI